MSPSILNPSDVVLQTRTPEFQPPDTIAGRIDARLGRIGSLLGLHKLGCGLVVVAPGKQAFPFHSHRHNDGLFVVLTGQGELRCGATRRSLREGDVIGCPAGGPKTAHAITNTGSSELRYLAISSEDLPEICDYADSGKFGIFDAPRPDVAGAAGAAAAPFRFVSRPGQHVDYRDGE